jgi:hypothetical protein
MPGIPSDPPPSRSAAINPFLRLTKNEARVLRARFIAGTTPIDPADQPIADRLQAWLDQVIRP